MRAFDPSVPTNEETRIRHVWFDTSETLYRLTPEFRALHSGRVYATYAHVVGESDPAKAAKAYDALLKNYASNSAVFDALGMEPGFWQREFASLDVHSTLSPDPTINDTLAAIKRLVPISVFTNLRRATLQDMLRHLQLPFDDFTHVIVAEDIAAPKPHLDGFRKMIELSDLPPEEILYVGDKVNKDVLPAKQLGIKTCIVWSVSAEADYSAPHFKELLSIVEHTAR